MPGETSDRVSAVELRYSHVRIYVSSVFQDKHFERQILANLSSYFREFCDSSGIQFQIVDLRHGMSDEVVNDILVSQLCRQEVAFSREISLGPSLVILAGMRYGYRCLPDSINRKEAIRLVASMDAPKASALFQDWFRIDANSLTKDYTIVPVSSRFPHFFSADAKLIGQKLEERDEWQNEIHLVGRSMRRAAKTVYKDDKLKLYAFTSSIFETEIVDGLLNHPGNPNEHCLCYKTRIIDINKFLLSHESVAKYIDMVPGTREVDQEAQKALSVLKELKIPQTDTGIGTENISEFGLVFGQDLIDTKKSETFKKYLAQFEGDLKSSVTKLIIDCAKNIPDILASRLSNEVETHLKYARNMAELKSGFLSGTESCVATISGYIESAEHLTPLVLYGGQGVGKSAVISRIVVGLLNTANSQIRLVVRFVGLTMEAQSICTLLRSVCEQLLSILGLANRNPPNTYPELKAFFHQLIGQPTSQQLVIILDGVDYLDSSDNGASADWLPKSLPPNARLIITTRPEVHRLALSGARSILQGAHATFLELTPIPDPELSQFLSGILSAHNRKMTSSQFHIVLGFLRSSDYVTPFYAALLLKDAVKWKSFSRVNQSEFSVSVNGMLHSTFAKLEQKYSALFVSECLSIITVARFGVTECELGDIVSSNMELRQELTHSNQPLSPIFWARLKSELTFPLLVHVMVPGGYCVMRWGHPIFRKVAQQRYLSTPERIMRCHQTLCRYFLDTKLRNVFHPSDPSNQDISKECDYFNPRNLLELPLNLVETGQSRALIGRLTNLEWMRLKIESVGVSEVLRDFALLFDKLPHSEESDLIGQLRILQEIIVSCFDSIGQDASCLAQKLANHLMGIVFQSEQNGGVKLRNPKIDTKYALLIGYFKSAVHSLTPPNLIPLSPSNARIGSEFVYELCNHFGAITCIRIKDTNDKKGMLLMTSSDDCTVRLWDLNLGKLLLVLVGHERGVKSCDMSTSASVAISGCADAKIKLWDLQTATCLQEMNGHSDSVNSVRLTKNGRTGISGSSDGNVCIWNCHRDSSCFGDLIYTLHAHRQPIRSLALSENEQLLLTGSDDNTVKIWNVASSSNCGTLEGHSGSIVSVSVLDTIILTSSLDGTVKSWSKDRLTLIQTFPANSYAINSVSLALSNGVIGLVACSHGAILVIDPKIGICKNSINAHSCVACVAMAPNGIWGVSGDEAGTIKVWTIGRELFLAGTGTKATHEGVISRVRFSPCEQFIATVGVDGYASVLELETSKVELSLSAHSQPINDLACHRDSIRFLTAGDDRVLKLWHGEDATSLAEFRGHHAPISSIAITQEGELIGSGDKKGNIFIWKLDNPEWHLEFPSELTQTISELQFIYRSNNTYLLCGCQDGSLTLWNVDKGCLVSRFDTNEEGITCLDTISHEWQAIIGTQSGTIMRWQLDSNIPLCTQPGAHKDRVSSLRYLNKVEPCHLVSSGYDGYIHLLESQSLIRLASFCLGESITSIDTNLIGSLVVYGTVTGVVGIIGVSSGSDVSAGLFERGPYLFKQDNKLELLGEYTHSYPTLLDNLDNENGLLEFADNFAAASETTNEMPDLFNREGSEPIFLIPRRQGTLAPITERSEEELEDSGTGTGTGTNKGNSSKGIQAPESNAGEQITSKICSIL